MSRALRSTSTPSPVGQRSRSTSRSAALLGLALLATVLAPVGTSQAQPVITASPVAFSLLRDRQVVTGASVPLPPSGLDRTGRTVPAVRVGVPVGAVVMATNGSDTNPGTAAAPVRTLNRAVALAPEGGTVALRAGVYRDWYHNSDGSSYGAVTKSLTFQAYPGETVWLDGADVVAPSAWTRTAKNRWRMSWSTPQFCDGRYYQRSFAAQRHRPNTGPCVHSDMARDKTYAMAGDPQMVFVNGRALRQVASLSQLGPTTFVYDWTKRRMYVGVDPAGRTVEAAVRPLALLLAGQRHYTVRGIGFRHYATNEYSNLTNSALRVASSTSLVEDSVFTANAASGLGFTNPKPGTVVRHSVFAANGYTGLGGNGASQSGGRNDLTVTGNVLYHNNAERFGTRCTQSCGQAAAKFAHMVGLTLSDNLVMDTLGRAAGLWCDLDCSDTSIIFNTITGNKGGAGIMYEVSSRGLVASNLVTGSTYGISVSSARTRIYNNTLVRNVQGINVYDDGRSRGIDGWTDIGPDTRHVEVVNNVVSGRNYSLMASSARLRRPRPNTAADQLFDRVDHNTFYQSNGAKPTYVFWRTMKGHVTLYRALRTFQKGKKLERGAVWLKGRRDPLFVHASTDLRIRTDSPAYRSAVTLPADVRAALGVPAGARLSRGAFGRS